MLKKIWLPVLAAGTLGACNHSSLPAIPEGSSVKMALLETTDIHSNVIGYNYYSLTADATLGWSAHRP